MLQGLTDIHCHLLPGVDDGPDEMEEAAGQLLQTGCGAVLIKGGHLPDDKMCDVLKIADEEQAHRFTAPKIESKNTHGTGCTLSSAVAGYLAKGFPLEEAVLNAKRFVTGAIADRLKLGHGRGPLNHMYASYPSNQGEKQ